MTVEISTYNHPPIPAHLAGVHRLGIALAHWATRAAARHALREEAAQTRARVLWENRCELEQLERQRDLVWSQWQLHQLR